MHWENQLIDVGNAKRSFVLHVPCRKNMKSLGPLVIALHGGESNGKFMQHFSGLDETSDKYGFIVLYPNGSGNDARRLTWNSGDCDSYAKRKNVDDVAFIDALIEHMIQNYSVDQNRVYVTGMSNGAMMAYRLGTEIPNRIATIAAIAGTLDIDNSSVRTPMPILHFHGTADEYVPYDGGRGPKSHAKFNHSSVQATLAAWIRVNEAFPTPWECLIPNAYDDGTTTIKYTYSTETDPENVVLYKIIGGGHTWPGRPPLEDFLGPCARNLFANEIMWHFFSMHSKFNSARKRY
jgi:polyhydroxybutyrate depolymerase